jgi:hypothetical protein
VIAEAFTAMAMALSLTVPGATAPTDCAMAPDERAWIDHALEASDRVMLQRLHLPPEARPTIIVFDAHCSFEAKEGTGMHWVGTPHQGKIRVPDGTEVDAGVVSFASQDGKSGERFFVMALPSVWRTAGLTKLGDSGLTGVFLHEFSHTRQLNSLKPVFEAAAAIYKMPDDFGDDSLQKHFQGNPAYVAAYQQETDLLYRAAAAPDPVAAKALARTALAAIEVRQKRFFVGDEAKWRPYDDLFLTMEGFGQWNGYAWLSDPRGGAMTAAAAQEKMRGSRKWWSQEEGLALFLVIDRFVPGWAQQAFGSPPALGIDLLRKAVAEPATSSDKS